MLKNKFLFTFTALTLFMASSAPLTAQSVQDGLSLGPSARPYGVTESSLVDTDYYEYDAQLWAPYDVTSMDGAQRLQTGFYAELGFAYLSISRPGAVAGADPRGFNTGNDFMWARELELGYMSGNDAGWGVHWLDLEGLVFVNGEDINVSNPMALTTTFDNIEINRQFRQRLSNGGWMEPYIGMRYTHINDKTFEDFGTVRFAQRVNNSALGGQVGTRYFHQYGRYRVGSDLSLGALYNSQSYHAYTVTTGANATGGGVSNEDNDIVPALDLGLRLDYSVTRDITIRGGVGLQYMWEGIARADTRSRLTNPNSVGPVPRVVNSDDFVAAGFSFGVDWKR